jgi:MATE family multidrug resistance protein
VEIEAGEAAAYRNRPDGSNSAELRALVRLSAPIALAQLGFIAMSLVDTAVIGRVSVRDLAGAGIGRSIAFGTIMVAFGVATALEPIAAQAVGARDSGRAWRGYEATLKAALLLWAPSVGAAFAATLVLPALGVDPGVIARVRSYIAGQAPGFAAMLAFQTAKSFLQAHGRTAPALAASLVANVVNVVVCNALVRGDDALRAAGLPAIGLPALGALGGGLAFSIASFVMLAFVAVAALRHRIPDPGPTVPLATVYRIGVPVGLQMMAEVGVFSLASLLAGSLGPEVAAAHQIAVGMISFTFMAALGVSGATAVRVGHAVGAGLPPRRVGMLGMLLGAVAMSLGVAAFTGAPGVIVRAFTTDPQVASIGVDLLRIAAVFQLFDGVQSVAAGALRGAGDVRFPFVANVVAHWLVGLPLSLGLGFALHAGARGIWWGLTAGLVVVAIALAARFSRISRGTIARV